MLDVTLTASYRQLELAPLSNITKHAKNILYHNPILKLTHDMAESHSLHGAIVL